MIAEILSVVICMIASYFDIKYKKIPNYITFPSMLIGLLLSHSIEEVAYKLLALVFIFILGSFKLMGMGDLKLWMALSCLLGFLHSSYCIGIAAGLLIIVSILKDKKKSLDIIEVSIKQLMYTKNIMIFEQEEYVFAPYILAGVIIFLTIHHLKGVII